MNELELVDHGLGQHEGIEVGLAHAAVDAVQRHRQRNPGIDQPGGRGGGVGLEVQSPPGVVGVEAGARVDPIRARRLERVDDVQIVGPGLGEILPRMGTRISADEAVHPVRRRTFAVVALERHGVVLRLVAEGLAKRVDPALLHDQAVPIIMADLVADMPHKRAVRLSHGLPSRLPLRVVGLGDVDGDEPVVMSREHPLDASVRTRLVGDQVEGEAALRVLLAIRPRQPPAHQGSNHVAFGELDLAPAFEVRRDRQVRHEMVVPAGTRRKGTLPLRAASSCRRRPPHCRRTGSARRPRPARSKERGRPRARSWPSDPADSRPVGRKSGKPYCRNEGPNGTPGIRKVA